MTDLASLRFPLRGKPGRIRNRRVPLKGRIKDFVINTPPGFARVCGSPGVSPSHLLQPPSMGRLDVESTLAISLAGRDQKGE